MCFWLGWGTEVWLQLKVVFWCVWGLLVCSQIIFLPNEWGLYRTLISFGSDFLIKANVRAKLKTNKQTYNLKLKNNVITIKINKTLYSSSLGRYISFISFLKSHPKCFALLNFWWWSTWPSQQFTKRGTIMVGLIAHTSIKTLPYSTLNRFALKAWASHLFTSPISP